MDNGVPTNTNDPAAPTTDKPGTPMGGINPMPTEDTNPSPMPGVPVSTPEHISTPEPTPSMPEPPPAMPSPEPTPAPSMPVEEPTPGGTPPAAPAV